MCLLIRRRIGSVDIAVISLMRPADLAHPQRQTVKATPTVGGKTKPSAEKDAVAAAAADKSGPASPATPSDPSNEADTPTSTPMSIEDTEEARSAVTKEKEHNLLLAWINPA